MQAGDVPGAEAEPPCPSGLRALPPALEALVEFLRLDRDLLAAAAEASPDERSSRGDLAKWVATLPGEERANLLVGLLEGADPHLRPEALRRFREQRVAAGDGNMPARTAGQLLEQAARLAEARAEAEQRRSRREQARRDREDAVRRGRELDLLARREPQAWAHVEELIATRLPRRYDEAARLLRDLRDLARRGGDASATEARIGELVARHASKRALVRRVEAALASEEGPGAAAR